MPPALDRGKGVWSGSDASLRSTVLSNGRKIDLHAWAEMTRDALFDDGEVIDEASSHCFDTLIVVLDNKHIAQVLVLHYLFPSMGHPLVCCPETETNI